MEEMVKSLIDAAEVGNIKSARSAVGSFAGYALNNLTGELLVSALAAATKSAEFLTLLEQTEPKDD